MQQVWRKRWDRAGWIALGAVTLVLLVSAVRKKNHKTCNGVEVFLKGNGNNFFIEEKGIAAVINAGAPVKGEAIENIDLKALEERLKKDKWIADAELFFDNLQVLHAIVEEKEPVARIFTTGGSSFYIDSACRTLPLSEKLSARVPMFTSFPSGREMLSRPDSELLATAKDLAMFIRADDFWKAQVEQIDITPEGFEMIPTVGNHVVLLGKDENFQQKFDRLFSFYKQVWTKVGFEKYEKIDVQFDGQVVATKKGSKPAIVDSAKVRMAYENLLTEVKNSDDDSTSDMIVKPTVVKGVSKVRNSESKGGKATKTNIVKAVRRNKAIKQRLVKNAKTRKALVFGSKLPVVKRQPKVSKTVMRKGIR